MGTESDKKKLSDLMLAEGKNLRYTKGEVIESSDTGNNLCLIKSGYVKRYLILNNGNIRVQVIYGPNEMFPMTLAYKALLNQQLYSGPEVYYYESLYDTELIVLSIDKFKECIDGNLEYYRDLFSEAGRRLYTNIQRLENLGLPTAYQRVAHEIAFYGTVFSDKKGDMAKLKIPLTQQDLADILSMTRETVSLCMSDLKKLGIIKPGRCLTITSMAKLQEEAFK